MPSLLMAFLFVDTFIMRRAKQNLYCFKMKKTLNVKRETL